jgi:hypothetical protein
MWLIHSFICETNSSVLVYHIPVLFPIFCLVETSLIRKITTESHILVHVKIECPDDRYPKLKIYILDPILDMY